MFVAFDSPVGARKNNTSNSMARRDLYDVPSHLQIGEKEFAIGISRTLIQCKMKDHVAVAERVRPTWLTGSSPPASQSGQRRTAREVRTDRSVTWHREPIDQTELVVARQFLHGLSADGSGGSGNDQAHGS